MKFKYSTIIADSKSDLSFLAGIPKRRPDISDRPITFRAPLAEALANLGVKQYYVATLLINQLYFWMKTSAGCLTKDGIKWIYNRYKDWLKQIPGLSEGAFGDVVRHLVRLGIIEKETFAGLERSFVKLPPNFHKDNQTSFLTLNMDRLQALAEGMGYALKEWLGVLPEANIATTTLQDGCSNEAILPQQQSTIYTEISISNPDTQTQEKKTGESINKIQEASQHKDDPWLDTPEQSPQPVTNQEASSVVEQSPLEDTSAPEVRESRNRKQPEKTEKDRTELYVWEVGVKRPYAVFLRWWADYHFKGQGTHWETGRYQYAYTNLYKDIDVTNQTTYPLFLEYMKQVSESANQAQANGLPGFLPPCFIPLPDATEENTQQAKENLMKVAEAGAKVLLPNNAAPGSTQSMELTDAEAHSKLEPLPELKKQLPPSQDTKPVVNPEVNEDKRLLDAFNINRTKWKLWEAKRNEVREWAKNTPGIVLTEDSEYGVSLEPELERRLLLKGRRN
jgi:hypothetical protein